MTLALGRGSLPANFQDFMDAASGVINLPTPAPQYFFARAAMAGRISQAAMQAGLGTAGARSFVGIMGGGKPMPELDPLVTISEQLPGLINVVESFGKNAGDSIYFQRPIYSIGGYSEADRELKDLVNISTTGTAPRAEEVPLTLKKYHGPMTASGTTPQPFTILNFDAQYRSARNSLVSTVAHHLSLDYTAWLNSVLMAKFFRATRSGSTWSSADTTYLTWSDESFSAVTSYVAGGGSTFTVDQLLRARQTIRDRYINPFPNGRYVALTPTCWQTQMLRDVQYRDMSKAHTDGRNQIFGYITSVEDIDIYEVSDLPSYAAAGTYAGGTVPTGVAIAEGILIGPGAVGFGVGMAPTVRHHEVTNYQEALNVVWVAYQSHGVLDDRGIQRFCAQTA
jgi:hypothetical protein